MSFVSIIFFIFLPVVLLLYFILPKKLTPILLLVASYYFYMSSEPYLIFIIVGVTLVSYFASFAISKMKNQKGKKAVLISSIIIILAVLIFFKYFNFLLKSATDFLNLFSMHIESKALDIILPIGISFYTFQTLSYVIDVYQEQYPAEKNIVYYALYVSFFPQLIAGPIERADALIPQLKEEHKFNKDNFFTGLKMMLVGYFCKCVVADTIGLYVDSVFNSLSTATSLSVFAASLLFMIQLFCDFFGYSEIARGIAKIMGINLSKNFDHPFSSSSFTEFWSRWHMTLSRWFNDYIYLPLSYKSMGSKHPVFRHILNTFIVFALSGLWHGANWTYVLWGLFSALIISIESLTKNVKNKFYSKHPDLRKSFRIRVLQFVKLMLILSISSILFRSQSIGEIGLAFSRLFTGFTSNYFVDTYNALGLSLLTTIEVILVIVGFIVISWWGEYQDNDNSIKGITNVVSYGFVALLVIICLLNIFHSKNMEAFIYFQF